MLALVMSVEQEQTSEVVAGHDERMIASADGGDLVGMYFEGIRIPLLTAEEEKELGRLIERGVEARELLDKGRENGRGSELLAAVEDGEAARRHFAEANLALVVWVAKKYRGRGLPFLDLIQECNVNLMEAIGRFDPDRNNKFATYAVPGIEQAARDALSNTSRTIRIPEHICDEMFYFNEAIRQLEQKLGQRPTVEEIVAAMKFSPLKVKRRMSLPGDPISLQKTVGPEQDIELMEFIKDKSAENPAEIAERRVLWEEVEKSLLFLKPREAKIIHLRSQGYLLREIGDMFGLSRERVRQLEKQAVNRLRRLLGTEEP